VDLAPHSADLSRLGRTDPDPRVRRRAGGLLLVAGGMSLSGAARQAGCDRNSLRAWARRFVAEGRDGLVDRGRCGRPRKLSDGDRALLRAALAASPLDHGYPVVAWSVADLTNLLRRGGRAVSAATVHRTLRAMGYRFR